MLTICVDNQGALRSFADGKCRVKEDLRLSLEGIDSLQTKGCSITGQCTPSHKGIYGNEQAHRLADKGQLAQLCPPTKRTINWLQIENSKQLAEEWAYQTQLPPIPIRSKVDHHLAHLPRYQASNILRLLCHTTELGESYLNPNQRCPCGKKNSTCHTLVDCPQWAPE